MPRACQFVQVTGFGRPHARRYSKPLLDSMRDPDFKTQCAAAPCCISARACLTVTQGQNLARAGSLLFTAR